MCAQNVGNLLTLSSRCHLSDLGASALGKALNSCHLSLGVLDLSANHISDRGAIALSNCCVDLGMASQGCTVESLVLSSNPSIGSAAVAAFARALQGRTTAVDETNVRAGHCSLKSLHLSGCSLIDDDAMTLGASLVPGSEEHASPKYSPSLTTTNRLELLNLHQNHLTLKGLSFLYSIVSCDGSGDSTGESQSSLLPLKQMQTLYSRSNHTVDFGIIVDYGTRDYNYGPLFDQKDDDEMLKRMRNHDYNVDEQDCLSCVIHDHDRIQLLRKMELKDKFCRTLEINRRCMRAINDISTIDPLEQSLALLRQAANEKVIRFLQNLQKKDIDIPRRQDEYGKFIDDCELKALFLSRTRNDRENLGGHAPQVYASVLFPEVMGWLNVNLPGATAFSISNEVLRGNPEIFAGLTCERRSFSSICDEIKRRGDIRHS